MPPAPARRPVSPVGAGTDATRVASYNPRVSLSWLVTSQTLGGTRLYPAQNRLDRETALRLWTEANTWFSNEQGKKGRIKAGQLADLALLSADYFAVPESEIVHLRSVLTVLGGRVVHGGEEFGPPAPALPAPMPDWSPVARFRRDSFCSAVRSGSCYRWSAVASWGWRPRAMARFWAAWARARSWARCC
mgnify:CR=1 FL=1